ncbi:MAG: hypothetical protein IT232_08695 [Flavobacteriales bacterium]|nr:hypothetical protein [Flavobacteriales bacterium]
MKIISGVILTLVYLFLLACGGSPNENKLNFENDMEQVSFWNDNSNNVQTIVNYEDAHSGKYVCRTDSVYRYSYLFKSKLGNISDVPTLKVTAKMWVKVKTLDARASLVISVDSLGTPIKWVENPIQPLIVNPNEWTEIKHELIFEEYFTNPEFVLGCYLWNTGSYEVLVDDMSIEIMR